MSYIGNNLQVAYPSYLIIDDISSQFNGVLKTFALRVAGSTPVPFPINPQQCLISVNNIVQKPDSTGVSGFTLTGSNIVFATAPTAGWSFFGTILAGADYVNVGANFPSGTAAIPSVTFDQSTGTGLFLASSNVLGITTGGVQRLVVNSSGFVGIGTSSPSSFLHLAAASGTVQMQFNSGGTSSYIGHDSAFTGFDIAAGGGIKFRYFNGASFAEAMRITSAGLVGIGTSSPGSALDVAGEIRIYPASGDANLRFGSGGVEKGRIAVNSSSNCIIETAGSERLRITSAGLVGIGTSSPGKTLDVTGTARVSSVLTMGSYIQGTIQLDLYGDSSSSSGVRIDSSGRVGIGTTSPDGRLHVLQGTTPNIAQLYVGQGGGSSNYYDANNHYFRDGNLNSVISTTSSTIQLFTSNTERARIDSSGRLLVGTSSARSLFFAGGASALTQIEGNSTGTASLSITRNDATADGNALILAKARSTSYAVLQYVNGTTSDDRIGRISFQGADGTNMVPAANIEAFVDSPPGANDMPGRLVFSTTADGASSPTERMRIGSDGNISIGSAASTSYRCAVAVASGADRDIFLGGISGTSNGFQVNWLHATTALSVKFNNITTTASAANAFLDSADGNRIYRSTSSLRYKKNVENIDQLKADAILSLRPVWYRSKASNDRQDWSWYGLIAEEVAQVEPRLVHWTYLDEDYETETVNGEIKKTLKEVAQQVPDGVQYDRLTVLLLDVVKRQQQAIETLEAKVAALESQ